MQFKVKNLAESPFTGWEIQSVFFAKDGTLVPYGQDENSKHSLKKIGNRYIFSIKDPQPEDAGFYQVDVDEANVLTTDFRGKVHTEKWWDVSRAPESTILCLLVPSVEFTTKMKDAAAVESEDAVFQCTLSTPLNAITWSKENVSLESGDKYDISVSEDKLIHTLRVKDCDPADKGKYYAIAGLTSSSASLTVKGIVLDSVNLSSDTFYVATWFLCFLCFSLADPNARKLQKVTKKGNEDSDKKLKLEEQTEIQSGKDDVGGEKNVGAAAGKVGVTSEEGEGKGSAGSGAGHGDGTGGDGCRSKTGGDGNDEDGKRKNQSKTGPLVPDDASGKNVLLMTEYVDLKSNFYNLWTYS